MKNEEFVAALLWRIKSQKGMMGILCVAFFILHSSFFISCSGITPEEQASLAAKGYYEHLVEGEWDAYMEGVSGTEGASADYVEQLRSAAKQYMVRLNQLHQGVQSVEVVSARTDSTLHCTQVFLVLNFGDATHEEICVPMVEDNGRWRMK
jgi:hypothetical protein